MFDEDLNVLDGTQEPVVEALETAEETGEGALLTDDTENPESTAEPQGIADPVPLQSREENKVFKEVRLKAEQRAREETLGKVSRDIADLRLINPVTGAPVLSYDDLAEYNRVKPIQDAAEARGVTFDEEVRLREQFKRELLQNDPEYQRVIAERDRLRQEHGEKKLSEDLAEIKRYYPTEQAMHVLELGEDFVKLCATGISPLVAYEAIKNGRPQPKAPPSMGDVKTTGMKEPINKYATMSESDFEKEIQRAERGELMKGR